jgi:hypothetical protein
MRLFCQICSLGTETHLPGALSAPYEFPPDHISTASQGTQQALAHFGAPINHDDLAACNKGGAHGAYLVTTTFLAVHVPQAEVQTGDLQASLVHRLSDEAVQALAGVRRYFYILSFYLNVHTEYPLPD